jgi:predicted transcriptional regulator
MNEYKPNFNGRFILIPAAVIQDSRLRSNSKLLYGEIYSVLNAQGMCDVSNATLSKELGLSINTLQTCLQELEKYGYIHREMVQDEMTGVVTRQITADGVPDTSHLRILRSNPNGRI